MVDWDFLLKLAPLVASILALYISSKVRPIEQDVKDLRKDHMKLEARFDAHLTASTEAFTNFNRWRGMVSSGLETNTRDHDEIKASLRNLSDLIMRHMERKES